MKLVTQRGIIMKKTIIYYLVTAALLLSLSSCGEKANVSSSEAEKTETKASVTSESESISESEPVSKVELEIDLGFNGEFNEEVFEKICQNVRIGDKIVSFPFTLNDLGDEYQFSSFSLPVENTNEIATNIEKDGEDHFEVTYIDSDADDREKIINAISTSNPKSNLSIVGLSIADSLDKVIEMIGEPSKTSKEKHYRVDYIVDENKYMYFLLNENNDIVWIDLDWRKV